MKLTLPAVRSLFVACAVGVFGHGALAAPQGAVDAYARLAERMRELEQRELDAIERREPRDDFVLSGIADDVTERWLADARPLAREFIAATALPYDRQLDYGAGFSLPLPHYSGMRAIARNMRYLAHDASLRGDTALVGELLRAQLALSRHAGDDRLLVGSLVSMGLVEMNRTMVDEFIERGALDAAAAKAVLDARGGVEPSMRAQIAAALGMEADIMVQEAGVLAAASGSAKGDGLAAKAKEQATAYRDAVHAAIANPDPAAMKAAIAAIEARATAGEFGEMLKSLAPVLTRPLERLDTVLFNLDAQGALLEEIASGAKKPEDLVNAARHYEAAAQAVEALSVEQQRTIDALRLAPDALTEADRREAHRAVEALRARVIDQIVKASRIKRCAFDAHRPIDPPQLLPEYAYGILGALRIALFDPLLPGHRPEDAPGSVDACVAALVAVRHFAEGGGIAHALVAQRFSRDVVSVLARLDAAGELDAAARERLDAEIARLKPADPFGLRRAVDFDRVRLARMDQAPNMVRSAGTPFGRERLANLSPDSIAFLVAVATRDQPDVLRAPCECAFDGPLLELRSLFDREALTAAQSQQKKFFDRHRAVVIRGDDDGGSALQGLTVTKPVDMEARFNEARADFERLQDFTRPSSAK